ncbi:MAG: hypothetical protein AAFX55_00895 [Bacteroidota bacterium]
MKLFKTIDKVLAAFGNIRAMERTHVDAFTEDLINNIKGKKIAESEFGQLFASFQTLSDYEFLNISVVSATNIKTRKGCDLVLESDAHKISIPSDTKEIESNFSNVSNRYLTKISFILNKKEKKIISSGNFEKVLLNFNKKSLPMNMC